MSPIPTNITDIHNQHHTATNQRSNLNSPPLTINDTTTNSIPNSTTPTINDIHNCHPTATALITNLNSTPSTDNETYNNHPSTMCTMDTSLYSPNPLSTPTPDCEAVPETVG